MTGYIGLFGLFGIAVFIALLFVRRKRIENEMTEFYKEHLLYQIKDEPPYVRESLDARSDNLYCCRTKPATKSGESIEFCWSEWYLKSNTMVNGVPAVSLAYYLAFSFAPNAVSGEFAQKAIHFADKSDDSAAQKVKDFFVTDTQNPYRAEILADGSLIICWQVLKRRDVYEAKIEWLKNNVSPSFELEITAPEKFQDATPGESDIAETVAPNESKILKVDFYKHNSYLEMRRKFTGAWANLRLELHRHSPRFYREGDDEFESDERFYSIETTANELLFTLTGETVKADARRLFAEHYSYRGAPGDWVEASIDGNFPDKVSHPTETETLDECNHAFYLPLNKYVYAEFKRRFAEKWTNLSVEVYPSELPAGEMPFGAAELPDDFEMMNLTRVNRLVTSDYFERDGERDVVEKLANDSVLRDGTYPADFETSLNNSGIFIRFKNEKLGVYWERKLNYRQLKDFQAAGFSEESKKRKRINIETDF